ncbi:MAG: aquaporin [Saprospiraceae bacterium]|nr:aquaporin [Saprospiraceae bacterium]
MKKYLTEFIGTFFLVLTAVLTTQQPSIAPMAPWAIAGIYLGMVYAGGHISGAHYNPALTLAAWIARKKDRTDVIYFLAAQMIAALLAASIGVFLHECGGGTAIVSRIQEQSLCVVMAEFLGTFALTYALMQVAIANSTEGSLQHGLGAAFILVALSYTFGRLSGGMFNPALAFGACVAGILAWEDFWVYLVGPVMGAAAGATVYQLLNSKDADY